MTGVSGSARDERFMTGPIHAPSPIPDRFEPAVVHRPEPLEEPDEKRNCCCDITVRLWNKMPLGKIVTPLYSHGRTSRKYSTKLTEIAGTIIFIVFLIQTFATTKQYGMLMSGTTVVKQVDYEPIHELLDKYIIKPSGHIGFNASRTRLLI